MLRITALSDFVGAINQKHLISLAAISIVLATAMEIAWRGPMRPLMAVLNTFTIGVLLLTLSFFVFASRNSVLIPRYGSSDLFLSVLLVVLGFMLWILAMKSLTEPGFFHPVFLILGAVTSLVFSGLLAVLLPLAHKIHVWLS
jgi:hypothetical protein